MDSVELLSREDLVALIETGTRLGTEVDQGRLAQAILERACAMTDSPDGSVMLFDADRRGLFFVSASGDGAAALLDRWGEYSSQRVPIQGSKAGHVFATGQTIIEHRLEEDSEHFKGVDEQTQKASQSMICVPLETGGNRIGVLQILNKRAGQYTERDRALLEQFAVQAAVAIKNAQTIRELAAHMGLYARDTTGELLALLNQAAKREEITLLFADMRGFTQLCQSQEDPARTQEIVNDLLTMLAEEVLTRGGIVNKFLGDAVFAFFRGQSGPNRAVRCAFGMVDRFESLRERWHRSSNQDLGYLDLGVGIATDRVAIGTFGNATVRDFTAIGTAVNLAAAFERDARHGRRVLVDQHTWSVVQDIVADFDKPVRYRLRKPGQGVGVWYWQYHLKRLKPDLTVRVFVSHSHLDRVFVEREVTQQLKKYGIETWYSNADIVPGDNYVRAIEAGLLRSDWVVIIVSARSVASDWVRAEVQTALKDPRLTRRIIPVVIDDTSAALVSPEVGVLQVVDARAGGNLAENIYQALKARANQDAAVAL
jgi:adenylate cyclase